MCMHASSSVAGYTILPSLLTIGFKLCTWFWWSLGRVDSRGWTYSHHVPTWPVHIKRPPYPKQTFGFLVLRFFFSCIPMVVWELETVQVLGSPTQSQKVKEVCTWDLLLLLSYIFCKYQGFFSWGYTLWLLCIFLAIKPLKVINMLLT